MRGLIVVVIGAVLIWIGLSRGDGGVAHAGDTEVETPAPDDRGADALSFQDPAPVTREPATPEPVRAAPEPEAYAAPEVAQPPAPVEDVAEDTYAAAAEAPPAIEDFDVAGGGTSSADRGYRLTGGSGPARGDVAEHLFDAWMARDASALETYLTVGDGVDLPPARAQLVAGFWEAMVGSVDAARERLDGVRDADGVTTEQVGLLEAALRTPGDRAFPRSASASTRVDPLAYAMRMVLLEDEARSHQKARRHAQAAMAWSDLVMLEVDAPWAPHREEILAWGAELEAAQAYHRLSRKGNWPYVEEKVRNGDALTLVRKRVLARRPDLLICTGLISEVNDLGRFIHEGQVLKIPTDAANVLVDLDARVLLYRHGEEVVRLWQVGIGKPGHETPTGTFTVGDKLENPTDWSKLLPPGAPGNDLGTRWLGLYDEGSKTSYGIHGTTDPASIGGEVSLGCVRMQNERVEELFEILPQGARVRIQH